MLFGDVPVLGAFPGRGPPVAGHRAPRLAEWPVHELELSAVMSIVLFTDGPFEGRTGRGRQRLGEEGLLNLARSAASLPPEAFVDSLIPSAEELAEDYGSLTEDVAVLAEPGDRRASSLSYACPVGVTPRGDPVRRLPPRKACELVPRASG
ncbi:SpoIIE family protein phosphatase [Streptomyces sp. NPDC007971]|uniref:SpoIIE family protein phosphatase n=1 Tax=Streptomyces sp. NPDC007971 TaxID=3364799 RepID=UPI0036EF47B9